METTTEKIVDRIRKLLALAQHPATNVEEAALAMGRAQELLFQHKLDMAQIEIDTGEHEEISTMNFDGEGKNVQGWKAQVLNSLAYGCYCRCIHMQSARNIHGEKIARHAVIGKPSDMQTVAYLYQYVCAEIDRLTEEHAPDSGKAYRNSFRLGASTAIWVRMQQKRREQDKANPSNETALVVLRNDMEKVNAYVKEKIGKTTTGGGSRISDGGAYAAGQARGSTSLAEARA